MDLLADVAPTPVDEPTAFGAPAPAGAVYRLEAAGSHLAEAAALSAAASGAGKVADARAQTRPAAATLAIKELSHLLRVLETLYRRLDLLDRLVVARLHRTRLVGWKAGALTFGLVVGEVSLNSSAAVYSGDVPWQAVLAFCGVGVATVAIGWYAGSESRKCADRLSAGPAPAEAHELGMATFYASSGTKARLLAALLALATSAVALAVGVGVLRADAGGSAYYGLFTLVVVIGAAAVAFVAEDQISDVLDRLLAQRDIITSRIETLSATVDGHHAASARAHGARSDAAATAAAQSHLAHGTTQLKLHEHPAVYGHFTDGGAPKPEALPAWTAERAATVVDPDYNDAVPALLAGLTTELDGRDTPAVRPGQTSPASGSAMDSRVDFSVASLEGASTSPNGHVARSDA